ncbi:MAG: chalcone isomerase family protein [Bdellovibrionales bacterium]|nr:chalcone isomerase family protein [Bdellovibrionales bacterium]
MKHFIFILFFFLSTFAFGQEKRSDLPLRGTYNYKYFFLDIYEAKLWSPKKDDTFYSAPLILELVYKREFPGPDIVKQTGKELKKAGVDPLVFEKWKPKLLEIFPDVKVGDSITTTYSPETGMVFSFNNTKKLGEINDLEFSKTFLNIWLGEKTSEPKMREMLLGRKN